MKYLVLTVHWLTGRCVAASVENRNQPEWPPHPGRLYMALAAACFERDSLSDEIMALKWLETLGEPEIISGKPFTRSATTAYVVTNDKYDKSASICQATPGINRNKQARSYPTTIPTSRETHFVWQVGDDVDSPTIDALKKLSQEVIRLGHSSSLVSVTAQLSGNLPTLTMCHESEREHWKPGQGIRGCPLRVATLGEYDRLKRDGMRNRIARFFELKTLAETGPAKDKRQAKTHFLEEFGQKYGKNVRPPEPVPATISTWVNYTKNTIGQRPIALPQEHFDPGLIVLSPVDGPRLGVRDTLWITQQLRNAVLSHAPMHPEWLTGHSEDQNPTKQSHLAFLPLPYAGNRYADGHLLGVAIAIPRAVPASELRQCLGPVFYDGQTPRTITLTLGALGEVELQLEQRPSPPKTLQIATWTTGSTCWESVTPVVLDRFPKKNRRSDAKAWHSEVRDILFRSCEVAGIPKPDAIDFGTTAFLKGIPRATRRAVRKNRDNHRQFVGDGFAFFSARPGKPPRPQVHVRLIYGEPISGPLMLGAGRFFGYGLLKPQLASQGGTQ